MSNSVYDILNKLREGCERDIDVLKRRKQGNEVKSKYKIKQIEKECKDKKQKIEKECKDKIQEEMNNCKRLDYIITQEMNRKNETLTDLDTSMSRIREQNNIYRPPGSRKHTPIKESQQQEQPCGGSGGGSGGGGGGGQTSSSSNDTIMEVFDFLRDKTCFKINNTTSKIYDKLLHNHFVISKKVIVEVEQVLGNVLKIFIENIIMHLLKHK